MPETKAAGGVSAPAAFQMVALRLVGAIAPGALDLAFPLLGLQALLPGGGARLGGHAAPRLEQRARDEVIEACEGVHPVLLLGAVASRLDDEHPIGGHAPAS